MASSLPSQSAKTGGSRRSKNTSKATTLQTSKFLNLPLEIRHNIYGFFPLNTRCKSLSIRPPQARIDYDPQREQQQNDRRLLFSICRQINEEWTPLFYRTAAVIVNSQKPSTPDKDDRTVKQSSRDYYGPLEFEKSYLSYVGDRTIRNIRTIEFEASIWKLQVRGLTFSGLRPFVKWGEISGLKTVLNKHMDQLKALNKVVLIVPYHGLMPFYTLNIPTDTRSTDPVITAKALEFWTRSRHYGSLDSTARIWQSGMVALQGNWTVQKVVNIEPISRYVGGTRIQGYCFITKSVSVVFTKQHGSPEQALLADDVVPEFDFDWAYYDDA